MKTAIIKSALILSACMAVLPVPLVASQFDLIGDYLVRDLTRQYMSAKNVRRSTIYISVLPFEVQSAKEDAHTVAHELSNSLIENISHESSFTVIDSGQGNIHTDINYHDDQENTVQRYFNTVFGINRARHCYIKGSISDDSYGFIATVFLEDAVSREKVAVKSVRVFRDDVDSQMKKKTEESSDSIVDGMKLELNDSFMQSPMNILAWLNDIYINVPIKQALNIKLGITNLYLETNNDISLMSQEVYPHFMTSPADGFRNFDPIVYTQFTQLAINRCVPYLGIDCHLHLIRDFGLRLGFNTSLFYLNIPVTQLVSVNPYADLMRCDEDARNVLDGRYQSFQGTGSRYPQVMFRIEAEPHVAITDNTAISLFLSCYYTPTLKGNNEYDDFYRAHVSEKSNLMLMGASIPFMGLSLKLSLTSVF